MSGSLVPYRCGEAASVERIRCPNPKCGRHILDIEEMPPGRDQAGKIYVMPKRTERKNMSGRAPRRRCFFFIGKSVTRRTWHQ